MARKSSLTDDSTIEETKEPKSTDTTKETKPTEGEELTILGGTISRPPGQSN